MSDLSSSSIESHMYAVFFVSPSSGGRRELEKQLSSKPRGTNRTKMTQGSLFLESVVKKVVSDIPWSPCNLSTCKIRLIVGRICMVGVKVWVVSRCLWVIQV